MRYATIEEMRVALQSGKASSTELTRVALAMLGKEGRAHNAVREMTEERALKAAAASDERRAKGDVLGPLDGIPYAVKDLLATKGIPTRWGSPGHADQVFDFDATVVEKLDSAGAVLCAKLAMIELAGGGDYDLPGASDVGATRCAWNKNLWAGGSSSGSGAAIGLGLLPFAIGSETSGSILCPSAFNGITGLRPTYGRVSRYGAMPLSWTLDKIGPMARTAEDAWTVLKVIAGMDPKDPSTTGRPFQESAARPLRVGVMKEPFGDAKACQAGYEAVLEFLRSDGYEVVEVSLPPLPNPGLIVGIVVDGEGVSAHEEFVRSDRLKLLADPAQVAGFTAALDQPTTDYLWAMRARVELNAANAIWEKCDVLFRPVFYHASLPAEQKLSATWRNMGDTGIALANLLGWPSCCFPMAWEKPRGVEGPDAPIGGQFIAPAYREDLCVRMARFVQSGTDWHRRRPTG